jgi:hypothetical protein
LLKRELLPNLLIIVEWGEELQEEDLLDGGMFGYGMGNRLRGVARWECSGVESLAGQSSPSSVTR